MKKHRLLYILIACFLTMALFQACKKSFLDRQPIGSLSEQVLANKAGVEALLIGAYSRLGNITNWGAAPSNWHFGSVAGGEAYKGSIPTDQANEGMLGIATWNVEPNNGYTNSRWVNSYNGIGRANETIRMIPKASDISADDQKRITAEARFLRGYFHFDLKKIFANIPYVDESITIGNGNTNVSNVDQSGNYVDIWPQIEADLQFAADNLPETQTEVGRANKWAAMSFLAKVYMFEHKYAEAKALFDQIIPNGKTTGGKPYDLVNYFSNFNPAQENSPESIFAYQASVNEGSGTNGNYGDNLNYPNSGGPGGCCGFFNPSISMANAYKTDANGLPLFDTYNAAPNVGSVGGIKINYKSIDSFYTVSGGYYKGTLDPRVDLVMGRPGAAYLDWGADPVDLAWIRDPATDGPFSPKKPVYAKGQDGLVSKETSFWGPTQMDAGNVNLIRFADVLLMAAEAEIEVGDPSKALTYVNRVRSRAKDPAGWVYNNAAYDPGSAKYSQASGSTPADNYKIELYSAGAFADKDYARKAVRFERYLELAEEGHRFFDLQRWDNGTGLMANTLNAYKDAEVSRPSYYSVQTSAHFDKGKDEIFPLPQGQIDQANSFGPVVLKQNPNY